MTFAGKFYQSLSLTAALLIAGPAAAQTDWDARKITSIDLGLGIHALYGGGGTIGISVGEDGVFMVDDQYEQVSAKVIHAVREISDKPIKVLLNTHWHSDHVGSNEAIAETGTVIIAHDNIRTRMSTDQVMEALGREVPASPQAALPVITFDDSVTLHFNGNDVAVVHVANAHTDGDSIVYFRQANVLHMGDVFFNGLLPFVDVGSGGSLRGLVAGLGKGLSFADENTKVIAGHGPMGTTADLRRNYEELGALADYLQKMIDDGQSDAAIIASKPLANIAPDMAPSFLGNELALTLILQEMRQSDTQ